jgi:signal transduction histidine kinase
MTWQITYVTWIHVVTAIISLQLVFTVYNMKKIRGRVPFIRMMALAALWSFILSFESAAPSIAEKVSWSQFEYFANMGIPLMFLQLVLSYNFDDSSFLKRYFWLLWIVPVVTIFLVFTNQYHQLIWTGFAWSTVGTNILVYHHGIAFFIAMAYSLGLIFIANILLVFFIRQRPGYYKSRAWLLLAGTIFPLLTGLGYTLGLSPVEGLDISPMGILIAGLIFFWGISRGQLFDIVPFSHHLMIEKMSDGVIILDDRNFIMDVSPVAMKALHIGEKITGQKVGMVLPILLPAVEGAGREEEFRNEIMVEIPDTRWFEVTRYPLKEDKDKFLGSMLILHDVTHRKRTQLQLQKLAEELTELNNMKDRLYSIIGHDLRSPFNSIMGFSQLLTESYDDFSDQDRKQFASNISLASRSAFNLLENLLEWSAAQLGKTAFSPEEMNLNLLVNETFLLLKFNAQKKDIALINSVLPDVMIYADRNMIMTVIRNLVSNGIKFTTNGGTVEILASSSKSKVEVIVADSGIGMTSQVIEKLFRIDTLLSTPGTENEKGTGLGLILSREFIDKHNGTLRVFSEPGKGSRFAFALPLKG